MITRIKFIGLLFIFILIGIAQGETKEVTKSFKLDKSEIERLVPDIGFAYATDMITIEGKKSRLYGTPESRTRGR
jgi:hypothetical protein